MQSTDRFLRDRGPIHFNLGSATISRRGWSDFRPRQLETEKLVTTLLLHTVSNEENIRAKQAVVLTDQAAATCKRAQRFLWQQFPLLVYNVSIDLFWEVLFTVDKPTAICHIASCDPDFDEAWIKAGRTISELDPRSSAEYFNEVFASWSWDHGKPILIEEAPGRTKFLELESKTQRAWTKLARGYQKFSAHHIYEQNQQMFNRCGWGVSSFLLDPNGQQIKIQSRTLELSSGGYGLGFGRALAEEIKKWKKEYNFPDVNSYISTLPSLALNGDLQLHLDHRLLTPDIQFGWNPVQTIMQEIITAEENTMILSLGQFPLVNLVFIGVDRG